MSGHLWPFRWLQEAQAEAERCFYVRLGLFLVSKLRFGEIRLVGTWVSCPCAWRDHQRSQNSKIFGRALSKRVTLDSADSQLSDMRFGCFNCLKLCHINDLLSLSAARTIHAERRMADVFKGMSSGCNTRRWQTVMLLFEVQKCCVFWASVRGWWQVGTSSWRHNPVELVEGCRLKWELRIWKKMKIWVKRVMKHHGNETERSSETPSHLFSKIAEKLGIHGFCQGTSMWMNFRAFR